MRYLAFAVAVVGAGAAADVPRVAVDIAPVHSIVAAVMGDLGKPALIVPPGASPHDHALRPSEAAALDSADLVVWMGHGLAPWLEGPVDGLAGDAVVLELLDHPSTQLLEVREGATFAPHDHDHGEAHDDHAEGHEDPADDHDDHGHEDHTEKHDEHDHDDHAKGHDDHGHEEHAEKHDDHGHDDHADAHDHGAHEGGDPHAWLDPENAVAWAALIAEQLGEMDPENAEIYVANADTFSSNINSLSADIEAILAPVKGRAFVVFHDAYHYFEHRFDIEAAGAVSSNDAVAPSAARLSELRAEIAALDAVCALTEPQFNPAILDALGATQLGEVDPLGATLTPGPDLYGLLLTNMATSLANCLK
ncbi:zinc ABC transporter substrate-binding protein [uncultured Tateyamaria sp.]|uniref:zinc ABC transporter substrate-binding protein n=1 Tax=uncultured Tateyamaria sp. TaxID=455651 RepID=UPI00262B72D7|nr:zinc ABC transporter substrate-binding protein [uncultured Tateyamaria sp.]